MKPPELCIKRYHVSETNDKKRAHAILKEERSRIESLIGALGFTLFPGMPAVNHQRLRALITH